MDEKETVRKIFAYNDGETWWVYAKDVKEALKEPRKVCDDVQRPTKKNGITIEEIPENKWKKFKVYSEDRKEFLTFSQWVLANDFITGGKPNLIAATLF